MNDRAWQVTLDLLVTHPKEFNTAAARTTSHTDRELIAKSIALSSMWSLDDVLMAITFYSVVMESVRA